MGLSPLHISFSPLYFQDLTEPRLNWKLVIEPERLSIMRFNAIIVPALLASSALAQSSSSTDMDPSMIMSSTDMDPSVTMPSTDMDPSMTMTTMPPSMEMSSTVLSSGATSAESSSMDMGASTTASGAAAPTNAASGGVGPAKRLFVGNGLVLLLAFGMMNVFLS